MGGRVRARPLRFFPRFDHLELCAPLVEASSGYAQLPSQFPHILASQHALDGHSLKSPGVSLSLHCRSFPGNCAHFCVSLQGFTPVISCRGVNRSAQCVMPYKGTLTRRTSFKEMASVGTGDSWLAGAAPIIWASSSAANWTTFKS